MLPIIVFVLALAFTWITSYFYANNILDSDDSSILVLADLLSKENAVLSQNWIYSTELMVIHTNLIFAPLMKIFTNWHTVRFVGSILLQGIMLWSYFYLCKQTKLGRKATFYSAAMLILPFSIKYGRIVLYHAFYLPFIAIGFFLVGMLISVVNHYRSAESSFKQWLRIAALLLLALLSGLNGVRQLMITMAPLVLASIFVTWKKEKLRTDESPEGFLSKWGLILLSLLICAMGTIGYLINNNILSTLYSFKHFDQVITATPTAERLAAMIGDYFSQFGYQTGRVLFSLPGILAIGGLFVMLFLTFAGIKQFSCKPVCAPNPPPFSTAACFTRVMFPFAVLVMLTTFVFWGQQAVYSLYLIPAVVWAIPLLACLIEEYKDRCASVEKWILTAACILVVSNGLFNNAYFIHPTDKQVTYEGLGYQNVHAAQDLEGAVDFLTSNGYEVGYATFWNANIVTNMTSGHIPMIPLVIDNANASLSYFQWLTNKNHHEEAFIENKRVFLLLLAPENEMYLQTPLADDGNLVYQDDFYLIYDFEYSDQPYYALLE
ncbi:MAG: hypothetical protein RR946_07205 [Clostridia bacterium]